MEVRSGTLVKFNRALRLAVAPAPTNRSRARALYIRTNQSAGNPKYSPTTLKKKKMVLEFKVVVLGSGSFMLDGARET